MAGRSVDVSLKIVAQGEEKATNALRAVAKAAEQMNAASAAIGTGSNTASREIEKFAKTVTGLQAELAKLNRENEKSTASQSRDAAAYAKAVADVDRYKNSLAALQRQEEQLLAIRSTAKTSFSKSFIGPRIPTVTGTQRDIRSAETGLGAAESTVANLKSRLDQYPVAQRAITDALNTTQTAIVENTIQYRAMTAEIDKAERAEQRRIATAQKAVQIATDAAAKQRNAAAAQTFYNAGTGLNRPSAIDAGAGFGALEAREAAAELKDAADAHKAFEDRVKQGKIAMDAEAESMRKLEAYARDVAESLEPGVRAMRLIVEEQKRLSAAVSAGALSQDQANAQIKRFKENLSGEAEAAQRASREIDQLGTYVQELRRSYDPAAYATKFLETETKKLQAAMKAGIFGTGKKAADEYAKALATVKQRTEQLGEKNQVKLFGLEPYQTQNLMFQFNDIATQLASGTSLTQTLAQQGGQILQLFPKIGNSIASVVNIWTVGAAIIIGGFAALISRAIEAENRVRQFGAALAANADGARYSADELVRVAKSMREIGITIDDAMKVTRLAVQRGFDQSQISEFAKSAKGLSVILGTDIPSAAGELATALRGGFSALVDLDEKTNLYTASELALIRELFEHGKAQEAVNLATRIANRELGDTADKANGPWAKAINNLATAWSNFLDKLANNTAIQAAVNGLAALAQTAADVVDYLDGVNSTAEKQARVQELLLGSGGMFGNAGLRDSVKIENGKYVPKGGATTFYGPQFMRDLDELNRLTAEIRKEQAAANDKLIAAQKAASQEASERVKKANAEVDAATKRLDIERKIKSQADVEAAVKAKRDELNLSLSGSQADEATRRRNVEAQLKIYREGLQKQLEDFNKSAKAETERLFKEQNTYQFQAAARLRQVESFASKAYPDYTYRNGQRVNSGYRVGYGSDTVTRQDGSYYKVSPTTTVTREMAERDLARRIEEFAKVVKDQIGSERFNKFSAEQQAALISVAYNYGDLPDRILKAARTGTVEQIGKGIAGLAGDNNGINAKRRASEAAVFFNAPNLAVDIDAKQQAEAQRAVLEAYNAEFDKRLTAEERSIANQKELVGLQGDELERVKRRQALEEKIAQALETKRRETKDPNAQLDENELRRITDTLNAQFDIQIPQTSFDTLKKQLADLQAYKQTLTSDLQNAQSRGDTGAVDTLREKIIDVDGRIKTAAQGLLDFLNTPGNPEAVGVMGVELENIIAQYQQLIALNDEWVFRLGSAQLSINDIANAFTGAATSALDQFAQSVANGGNAIKALWTGFRQFAADFLLQIAKMIQQQIIFNLVSGLLKGIAGGIGGNVGGTTTMGSSLGGKGLGAVAGMRAHGGGVIGNPSTYGADTGFRTVDPSWFATANRYHTGGIAGLKPNEVPAVLMQGEEVLTRDDPRHIMNGGGGSGGVKIVNTFNEADFFSSGANTKAGEKAILNMVRSNPRAFKSAMSGG